MPGFSRSLSRLLAAAALLSLCALCAASCASSSGAATAQGPKRALYRPGESLSAHLCACQECFDRGCCNGEPSASEEGSATELGMAVSACGRCVRRTWTVRGTTSCASRAPEACCPGSLSE